MKSKLNLHILPEEQAILFEKLSSLAFIHDFYLAGGTCLALRIGHRRSVDFDFFTYDDFDTRLIIDKLVKVGD